MIPGSPRRLSPGALLGMACVVLGGVFALLFRDYRTEHFIAAGIVCLLAGLLHAVPAALPKSWRLVRGFVSKSSIGRN
jgi:drug/metabolite transporter (DMT)-like permease